MQNAEIDLHKSVALINRANRFQVLTGKRKHKKFQKDAFGKLPDNAVASIFISCVDNVKTRFEIAGNSQGD